MGVTIIADSVATAAGRTVNWTRTTMGAQLLRGLSKSGATVTGATPDALTNIIVEAFGFCWECHNAQFRQREMTFSVASGDSEYSISTTGNYPDFHKFEPGTVAETTGDTPLVLTNSAREYEARRARYTDSSGSLTSGQPELALIVPNTSLGTYGTKLMFVPQANAAYTYRTWYLCRAPSLAATEVPVWPTEMFRLWHLEAAWRAEKEFIKGDDRWKSAFRGARGALQTIKDENDQELIEDTSEFYDGYNDLGSMASSGMLGPGILVEE